MIDYVIREDVLEILSRKSAPWDSARLVKDLPAADVREVVRAANKSEDGFLCSACLFGDFGGFHGYKPNFCPNCGADMRQKEG